jgi:predicted amidophosphoribosyltransferase
MNIDTYHEKNLCKVCWQEVSSIMPPCPACELASHADDCSSYDLMADPATRTVHSYDANGDASAEDLFICIHCAEDET